jgi:hypothetical protein
MTDTPPVSGAPNAGPRAAMNGVRQPRAIELKLSDQRNLRRAFTGTWRFQISVSTALNDVRDRELMLAEIETVAGVIPAPDVYMPTAATAAVLRFPLAASWGWRG